MPARTPRYGFTRIVELMERDPQYHLVPAEAGAGMVLVDARGVFVAYPRDERAALALEQHPDLVARLEVADNGGVWHVTRHRRHQLPPTGLSSAYRNAIHQVVRESDIADDVANVTIATAVTLLSILSAQAAGLSGMATAGIAVGLGPASTPLVKHTRILVLNQSRRVRAEILRRLTPTAAR